MGGDAELDQALDQMTGDGGAGTETPATGGTETPSSPGTESGSGVGTEGAPRQTRSGEGEGAWPVKVAGREYKSRDDLIKSHERLYGEASPWLKFADAMRKNPDLYRAVSGAVEEYNKARAGGATRAEATRESGVSPALAQRLERLEANNALVEQWHESNKLGDEVRVLRGTGASKEEVNAACKVALRYEEQGVPMPLEMALEIARAQTATLQAKRAQEAARRVGGDTKAAGQQAGAHVIPSPSKNPVDMSEKELDQYLDQELAKQGFKD